MLTAAIRLVTTGPSLLALHWWHVWRHVVLLEPVPVVVLYDPATGKHTRLYRPSAR